MNKQFSLKYTDQIVLQNKIFSYLPSQSTSRWMGNKQYFKSGLSYKQVSMNRTWVLRLGP